MSKSKKVRKMGLLADIIDREVEMKAKQIDDSIVRVVLETAEARINIYSKTLESIKRDLKRIKSKYEEEEKDHRKYRENRKKEIYKKINQIEKYLEEKSINTLTAIDIAILSNKYSVQKELIETLRKYIFIDSYCYTFSYYKKLATRVLNEIILQNYDDDTRKEIINKCIKLYYLYDQLNEIYDEETFNDTNEYADIISDLEEKLLDLTDTISILQSIKETCEHILTSDDDEKLLLKKQLIYLINTDKSILNIFV